MTYIIDIPSKPYLSAGLAAWLAVAIVLVLGTFAISANAQDWGNHRDHHGWNHDGDWNRGYYQEPPIIYDAPYYYPPPVVYGPGIGLSLPGVSIRVR